MMRFLYFIAIAILIVMGACSSNLDHESDFIDEEAVSKEEALNVTMYYSDSAKVRVKVTSPRLIRHLDRMNPVDEFPEGLKVEFFNNNGRVRAWMTADKALRYENERRIIVNENVELYNSEDEKLETSQLIWEEEKQVLHTNRFVTITRPKFDEQTSGFGIEVDSEFSRFEIKHKLTGRFKVEDPTK